MASKKDIEEFANLVFQVPLEPLSNKELDALYGPQIKTLGRQIGRAIARQRAAALVVSLVREAESTALGIVEAVGGVVANFIDVALPLPNCSYATRGLGAPSGTSVYSSRAKRIEATTYGDGANLKLIIEDAAGRCNVRVRLEDTATNQPMAPMVLLVEDRESGETLLAKKDFPSGEAMLRGVEPGEYWIEADSGDKYAGMSLKVEGAAR